MNLLRIKLAAMACALAVPAFASIGHAASTRVPGTANPFYAGRSATGPSGNNSDGTVPPRVSGTFPAGTVLGFQVTGSASYVPSCCAPLDGVGVSSMTNLDASTGIAGVNGGRLGPLVGVLLGNGIPRPPAPARLDFSTVTGIGISFKTLQSKLNQIFFIGDGVTGSGTGQRQRFVAPKGATRLFLAVDDGYG